MADSTGDCKEGAQHCRMQEGPASSRDEQRISAGQERIVEISKRWPRNTYAAWRTTAMLAVLMEPTEEGA
ncbi:MAG: hypothetical protein KBA44_00830 [Methanoculleus sp.]|jgi:hypothetical protein|nr:hypothetical protein [Methanoculleus sp.]